MTEEDWPAAVRDVLGRFHQADTVTKPFPRGFPHDETFVAVAAFIRDPEGNVLLVRHRSGTHWRDEWATPGGLVQDGETPEEAIRREVLEECGLDLPNLALKRVVVMEDREGDAPRTSFTLIFEAQLDSETEPSPGADDPVREAKWFPPHPLVMEFRDEYEDLA